MKKQKNYDEYLYEYKKYREDLDATVLAEHEESWIFDQWSSDVQLTDSNDKYYTQRRSAAKHIVDKKLKNVIMRGIELRIWGISTCYTDPISFLFDFELVKIF